MRKGYKGNGKGKDMRKDYKGNGKGFLSLKMLFSQVDQREWKTITITIFFIVNNNNKNNNNKNNNNNNNYNNNNGGGGFMVEGYDVIRNLRGYYYC